MQRNPTIAQGAIAGLIGGAALAVWFLIIDLIQGTPFYTPMFVASAVADLGGVTTGAGLIALYTLLHFAAFVIVGIIVAWAMQRSGTGPHFLLGVVLGFLLFDLIFYGGVVMTGVDVVRELGWPQVLIGNLIAGVALVGYLHLKEPGPAVRWRDVLREHRIVREGIYAGLIGAIAVAVWFLAIDLLRGQMLFTPGALGSALFFGARGVAEVQVTATTVLGYTLIHFAAFLCVGIVASALAAEAEKEPSLILGLGLLFVTFEVLFIGLIAIAAAWLLDALAWWMVLIANLIAAAAMGAFLWHEHPLLQQELSHDLEEDLVRDPAHGGTGGWN